MLVTSTSPRLASRTRAVPPGPADVHDLADMRADPLGFVTELYRRHGDITAHRVGADTVYTVNRPELARWVLKDNGGNYTKKGTPDDFMLTPLLGNGLLTSTGAQWARQRRMCAPAFRSSEVRGFDWIITDATAATVRRWETSAGTGRVLPVDHQLTALTLAIVVRAILSVDVAGIGDGFGQAVDRVNSFIGHFTSPGNAVAERRDYDTAKAFLDAVTQMLIAGRRGSNEGGPPTDLLGAMMASGHIASDRDLHDQVLTLIMAGHETTAKSLTWTLYLLDRNPDAAEAVYAEVDRVLAGRVPTAGDYPALVECTAAIKEAMRLYPPIWLISRRAIADDVIAGYDVPAGTLVCLSQWVLHRDPRNWDDPLRYDPQRFTGGSAPTPHAYLPFGGGDRVCIGQHFALIEATLALAMIAQRVRLHLVPGSVVEPEALVTLRPKHGMPMVAVPR